MFSVYFNRLFQRGIGLSIFGYYFFQTGQWLGLGTTYDWFYFCYYFDVLDSYYCLMDAVYFAVYFTYLSERTCFYFNLVGNSIEILVRMIAQKLVFPKRGNSLSPYILLNKGLSSYSQAVRMKLLILNSSLSTKSKNFLARSFLSGIMIIPSPYVFRYFLMIYKTVQGAYLRLSISGSNKVSNLLVNLKISFGSIFIHPILLIPFFSQLFVMFCTTSSLVSHMTTFLQSAHCLREIPDMPTPARKTITSFPRNLLFSSIANLAATTSVSHNLNPSSSWGNRAMSEMSNFILKAQCSMMSLFRRRRIILLPSELELCLLFSLPMM